MPLSDVSIIHIHTQKRYRDKKIPEAVMPQGSNLVAGAGYSVL